MGRTDKKSELPSKDKDKSKKPSEKKPSETREDDDIEDGDFATPKRDRDDEDDQPL